MKLFSIFLILMLMTVSCAKKKSEVDLDPDKFFNIVYTAKFTRGLTNSTWNSVLGTYQVKFSQNQEQGKRNGSFVMYYSSYLEPQFCPYGLNCVCSGGISGLFDVTNTDLDPIGGDQPYNPMDPYLDDTSSSDSGDPISEVDPVTGKPKIEKIYTFFFDLSLTQTNLSSGCKPESDKVVKIIRYANGNLVMKNDYREVYMIPQIK